MTALETVETLATSASSRPLVILGLDATLTTPSMIEWAAQEAIARGASLEIVACSATCCADPTCSQQCTTRHGGLADSVAATREHHPTLWIEESAIGFDTPNALVDKAARADLLIVGAAQFETSCIPSAALRRRSCPVVALRGQYQQPLRRIVIGIDSSNAAEAALNWAADEADRQSAELIIIHTWQRRRNADGSMPSLRTIDNDRAVATSVLEDAVDRCSTLLGRAVSCELVDGSPAAALAAASMDADLLAVGSRGSTGYRTMLFGSVTQFVLDNSDCPVAVIHPQVRVAPK